MKRFLMTTIVAMFVAMAANAPETAQAGPLRLRGECIRNISGMAAKAAGGRARGLVRGVAQWRPRLLRGRRG